MPSRSCLPRIWSWVAVLLLSTSALAAATVDAPPTIATVAAATPALVVAKTTKLSVLGADDRGVARLTYTWSATGPAVVAFNANGTPNARTVVAGFRACGSYVCTVTVKDSAGQKTTSSVNVTVTPTVTALSLKPSSLSLTVGDTAEFTFLAKDQFGAEFGDPELVWTATGAASVDFGMCTAGATPGSATVTVSAGAKTASASVQVVAPPPGTIIAATATPISELMPADRLADWRAGITIGVPGGISTKRTRLIDVTKAPFNADNTGATNAQPAIMQAVGVAVENDVIYLPAGTYRLHGGIGLGGRNRVTLRGAGPGKTILMVHEGNCGASIGGGGADWWYPDRLKFEIKGSAAKGAKVLNLASTKALEGYPNGGVGLICQVSLKNDPSIPVVVPANFDYMRKQVTRIIRRTDTTITISPPLLFDLPAALAPLLRPTGASAEFIGIEDLTVDGKNGNAQVGVAVTGYGCWVKNVEVLNINNYHLSVSDSLQCEIRHCTIATRKGGGSNGAGFLVGSSSNCLFEDNILIEQFPHIEVNTATGNVFAYNFCHDSAVFQGDFGILGVSICSNHNAQCSYNLYEGNVSPKFQSDGYHGSASHDTAFRNWFHGTSEKTKLFWICVNLNRFTRHYSLIGNVLGHKAHSWSYDNGNGGYGYDQHLIYSFGMPNMGNGGHTGTVQPSKGQMWADWPKLLASSTGLGPGPGGFQELDLDVKATTILKGNYNYRDKGVAKSEAIDNVILPNSLYLKKKPAWFGDLNWPAFGPDTDLDKNKIPAQVRFEEKGKTADAAVKK